MRYIIVLENQEYHSHRIVCQRFGVDRKTIKNCVSKGALSKPVRLGRHNYYDLVAVERRALANSFTSSRYSRPISSPASITAAQSGARSIFEVNSGPPVPRTSDRKLAGPGGSSPERSQGGSARLARSRANSTSSGASSRLPTRKLHPASRDAANDENLVLSTLVPGGLEERRCAISQLWIEAYR